MGGVAVVVGVVVVADAGADDVSPIVCSSFGRLGLEVSMVSSLIFSCLM